MSKFEKFKELAVQIRKSGMDSRAGLLEALAVAHNDEVARRVKNLITSFSTSIKSLLDLPRSVEFDIYDLLMSKFAQEVKYVSEDGTETKAPADVGVTDVTTAPDEIVVGGKKYKKMTSTVPIV